MNDIFSIEEQGWVGTGNTDVAAENHGLGPMLWTSQLRKLKRSLHPPMFYLGHVYSEKKFTFAKIRPMKAASTIVDTIHCTFKKQRHHYHHCAIMAMLSDNM